MCTCTCHRHDAYQQRNGHDGMNTKVEDVHFPQWNVSIIDNLPLDIFLKDVFVKILKRANHKWQTYSIFE